MSNFDASNRYTLHTKVRLFVHDQLGEYCNQSSKDFSSAIRDFIESGLDKWQSEKGSPRTKDSELLKAVKDAESLRERKKMLKSIMAEKPDEFQSLCELYDIDPDTVVETFKESPTKKRDLCRYYLLGVLSNGSVPTKRIKELCSAMGFSENQMYRSLKEIASSTYDDSGYCWNLKENQFITSA